MARIAACRKRRGTTQGALAGLVGRSESWLSQVERGLRTVDRLSVLQRLADVLDVSVETLTGEPAPTRRAATNPFSMAYAPERVAPELLRYYVTSHVIIRDLLRRERQAQTPALRPLAARAGVL